MQRLWPLQNGHFKSKIKIGKNTKKETTIRLEVFCAKNRLKKH